MRPSTLVLRSLAHYRRSNAAVVAGVAVAVAVLAGALLVGRSVRTSLQMLAEQRIGRTDVALVGTRLFEASLAERLASGLDSVAPVLSLRAVVVEPSSSRRASPVEAWGVDERFWRFHGLAAPPLGPREALLSPALAAELGVGTGGSILLRAEGAQDVPGSTLFGRRDEPGRALRLRVAGVQQAEALGEFSLRPRQDEALAVFVPLEALQAAFGREGRVNLVLGRGEDKPALEARLAREATLADLGLRLREVEPGQAWSLESDDALLADSVVEAAREAAASAGASAYASLVYLATELRVADASLPYSLVAAVDPGLWQQLEGDAGARSGDPARTDGQVPATPEGAPARILLNEWTARELRARVGDALTLEYYVWQEEGRIETRRAPFRVAGIVPIAGRAADRELVPDYPGITRATRLADWDPPFAVDLSRVQPRDEAYWQRYGTTPKAWLPLAAGQELWGHRLGRTTSLRLQAGPGGPDLAATTTEPAADVAAAVHARAPRTRARALRADSSSTTSAPARSRGARHDRLRPVLRLLQLLPGGGRAAAGRALLPLRRRAAPAARSACCARLESPKLACAVCFWPRPRCSRSSGRSSASAAPSPTPG